ncbi:MAG: ABC transporter ATP-binding protein [Phycisphaerae bacterium]|jgi:ATP-binding cassette subfamily B protein/subfamily B ATP-binding cassette protein MsbA
MVSSRARFREYLQRLREWRTRTPDGRPKPPRHRPFWRLFLAFLGLLKGHRRTLVLALGALSVSTLLGLLPLYATKIVMDNVLAGHSLPGPVYAWWPGLADRRSLLLAVTAGSVLISAVSITVSTWGRWQTTRVTKRVQMAVRRRVFEHTARLPLHRVYELKSGGVASILREDAGGVADLIFSMLYNPCRAIIQLAGSLAILAWVDWRLLLGSLLLLPTVYFSHRTWISRIRPQFRGVRKSRERIDSHATEVFGGMRIVRGFSRQRTETTQFTRNNHLMARQELLAWWWMRGIEVVWAILIPLASALLLWYGGTRILSDMAAVEAGRKTLQGALTVGDLVMFLSYLVALLSPLETLANSATTLQNNLAGLDRTLDLLEEPQEAPPRPGAVQLRRKDVRGRITLHDVGFAYPGSTARVIQNVSLDVAPGEVVALVGRSGAGKTTLCNLVARFFDPTEGRIELDGRDLRDIEIGSYRRLLGIVEQDTFLFDGTIAENIGYGRRSAGREEIRQAAILANADKFIAATRDGYDTLIGERGVKLSGGQRQRIAIARAILADPSILILDEATSNLDTESERLIQTSLRTLMTGRTCFIIAHRLSTIAHADRIVVLDHGKVVEEGSHEELMARNGRYRAMADLQYQPLEEREEVAP